MIAYSLQQEIFTQKEISCYIISCFVKLFYSLYLVNVSHPVYVNLDYLKCILGINIAPTTLKQDVFATWKCYGFVVEIWNPQNTFFGSTVK